VVRALVRRDELEVAGLNIVQQQSELFLTSPRPPVLKDYFDPELRMVVRVPRTNRQVRIGVQVEQLDVPAS
jgi:hypothetical protein